MRNDESHRRQFLRVAGATTAATIAGATILGQGKTASAMTQESDSKTNITAEAALKELMDGNERFVTGRSKHPRSSEDWLQRLTSGQDPIVTILACSDSRVPLELLFDQGFGDIFAIRVAGNVVTRYGIGSLEYAQHHLRTPLYMILGHEGCGAVTAALLPKQKRDEEPKGVRELLDLVNVGTLDPNLDDKQRLVKAVEANARNSTQELLNLDPDEEGFKPREDEMMVTAVYEISTGRVRILEKFKSNEQRKK